MAEFRSVPEPTEEQWGRHVDDLEALLCSLVQAGWELPESYDSDFDSEHGAFFFGELHRTGMVISVQYEPSASKLQLLPFEGDGDPLLLSMLDEMVEIRAGHDLLDGADLVAERAGELGLLDATHLAAAPDSDITTAELISYWYREEIFESAARYRGLALDELAGQLAADEEFSCACASSPEWLVPAYFPVAGSTSYTRHWSGQGRWPAICREVISDATQAAIALPAPYDAKGAEVLLRDLIEPDTLSDDVLAWMIDIPGTGGNGPWGIRGHESTRPVTREFALYYFGDAE